MAFTLNPNEIIDLAVMTGFLGFIFMDIFRKPAHMDMDMPEGLIYKAGGFDWRSFWFACSVTAPAIILHELGHKTAALSFGLSATFHAAYSWLFLGLLLKLMNFGFIFFIPGYVTHSGIASPVSSSLISFAGPFVNLSLWIIASAAIKYRLISKKHMPFALLTRKINLFLFIFNMLPIPPFDGYHAFRGLFLTLM